MRITINTCWENLKEDLLNWFEGKSWDNEKLEKEAWEAYKKINSLENLETWYYNYFNDLSDCYYNHFEIIKEKDCENENYIILIEAQTYEFKEFERVKNTIHLEVKPLEFIKEQTNWNNELIDSIKYSLNYFEEENENLTQFELENEEFYEFKDKISDYKKALKKFILEEIEDNLLS